METTYDIFWQSNCRPGTVDAPRVRVAVQAVKDKIVLVDSFHDAHQFIFQVEKTSQRLQTERGSDVLDD